MKTKAYVDIDLVILANETHLARHAHEFLERVTNDYDAYWLTTHCRGDAQQAIDRLSLVMPPETLELAKRLKPTNWDEAKTEGIDFNSPFVWFDDELYDDERETLITHNALDNWIEVDLARNPDQLRDFVISLPLPVSELNPL